MPGDPGESAEFDRIVERLRAGEPPRRPGRRWLLPAGIALCLLAITLVAVGGVKGIVLAVVPWLAGLFLVIRSRSGDA